MNTAGFTLILLTVLVHATAGIPNDGDTFTPAHRWHIVTAFTLLAAAVLIAA